MDTHPVPQNVTAFEFHLVGDMTIKQFSYLAAGVVIAYVTFIVAFNSAPLISIIIMAVSSLTGAAFAFIPIQDRPLDHWASAYVKAVLSPTRRRSQLAPTDPVFSNRLQSYLQSIHATPVITTSAANQLPLKPRKEATTPTDTQLQETVVLGQKSQAIQTQIANLEKQLAQLKTFASAPGVDPQSFGPQLKSTMDNLQNLMTQAQSISARMEMINSVTRPPITTSTPNQTQAPTEAPHIASQVKVVEAPVVKNTQISLTEQPNVINGIISDPSGNYIENVVVVIHNREGLPVRASKTNKLGQFAGATPLPQGEYTITLEKEGMSFDTLQLTLAGEVLSPLEIKAKGAS